MAKGDESENAGAADLAAIRAQLTELQRDVARLTLAVTDLADALADDDGDQSGECL